MFVLAPTSSVYYLALMATKAKSTVGGGSTTNLTKSGSGRAGASVKFASVVIKSPKPDKAAVAANIVRSSEALERVAKTLVKPGFSMRARKDVPLYSVDPADSGLFVRQLNGRTNRGRLVEGQFEVVD